MMLPQIATPKYDMIVPSTGKSITYRPYVVREEKILLIAMESGDEKQIESAVVNVINACVETGINIEDLTTFDVEYIFVTLRSKSVGEGINITPKCKHCNEINKLNINLDEVKIANLKDAVDKHVKLTDDMSLDLRWQTMKDRHKDLQNESETQTVINMIATSLDTIYSGEDTFAASDASDKEIHEFVESLNTDQFNNIVEILANAPYLSYEKTYNCIKCDKENSVSLNGLNDFF